MNLDSKYLVVHLCNPVIWNSVEDQQIYHQDKNPQSDAVTSDVPIIGVVVPERVGHCSVDRVDLNEENHRI